MDSDRIAEILINRCQLFDNDKVIVGVSAGPDSIALLNLLHNSRLNLHLICVYIDHGLRPEEIPNERKLVLQQSKNLNIKCEIVSVDAHNHKITNKTSLEESCRILRYNALELCRKKYQARVIAVAHTADDQAEEILLRLLRGTGLTGLSGMKFKNKAIVRPLLTTTKKEIQQFLRENKIKYCLDSTNADTSFLRNRIRLDLLPYIRKRYNNSIRSTLLQTTEILQVDDDFIQQAVYGELEKCLELDPPNNLGDPIFAVKIDRFLLSHAAIQRRIIDSVCRKSGSTSSYQQITDLCSMISNGRTGAEVHLSNGIRVVKTPKHICFFQGIGRQALAQSRGLRLKELTINGLENLEKEHGEMKLRLKVLAERPEVLKEGEIVLDADAVSVPLYIREPVPGEKFTPSGMKGRKKVSRFLTDLKIPHYLRSMYPVIADKNGIVGVVGLRAAHQYAATDKTTSFLLLSWLPR